MNIIGSDTYTLVIGLGKTGYACVKFLANEGCHVVVADSREEPPYLANLKQSLPQTNIHLGGFNEELCCGASRIVLSPGVAIAEPEIQSAIANGVPVISEIDLFSQAAQAPVVAITGSNAKSTVTSLVGDMANRAGLKVAIGGNLGTPVLDLLDDQIQLYVMELSSFQLETTHNLGAEVATVLNISPDHMDRYDNLAAYHQAKHRIFQGCNAVVENAEDLMTRALVADSVAKCQFTTQIPDLKQFGIRQLNGEDWLHLGLEPLIKTSELALQGRHNYANCLAALALGRSVNLPMSAMLEGLRSFIGLPYRCEFVAQHNGVAYINDSKGTNVGATVAAIAGLGADISGKIVLMAGGVGKGASFSDLAQPMRTFGRAAIVYGRDGADIDVALHASVKTKRTKTMCQALELANKMAKAGDIILLSPACSSFDEFNNFEHRGECFNNWVHELITTDKVRG